MVKALGSGSRRISSLTGIHWVAQGVKIFQDNVLYMIVQMK
jgi:hypothetical protein